MPQARVLARKNTPRKNPKFDPHELEEIRARVLARKDTFKSSLGLQQRVDAPLGLMNEASLSGERVLGVPPRHITPPQGRSGSQYSAQPQLTESAASGSLRSSYPGPDGIALRGRSRWIQASLQRPADPLLSDLSPSHVALLERCRAAAQAARYRRA